MNKYFKHILLLIIFMPLFASAEYFSGVKGLIVSIGEIVKMLTTLVGAIALLVFFYGLMRFIFTTSATGKSDGKKFMIWGIVALFVMVSVWGIVGLLQRELGLPQTVGQDGRTTTTRTTQSTTLDVPCSNFDPDGNGPCEN